MNKAFNSATQTYVAYSSHPYYKRWRSMINRCTDSRDADYKYYGGRGISIAPELFDFRTYVSTLDSLPGKSEENTSIDRIDNDGNYEPSNLCWASKSRQMANRRPYIKEPDCAIYYLPNKHRNPYRAYVSIKVDGKHKLKHIGYFPTHEDALQARCDYLKDYLPETSHWQKEL